MKFGKMFFWGLATVYMSCRSEYKNSSKICNGITVERFTRFASGAYGGDMVEVYVTDSATFRKFVGKYDESEEGIYVECNKDSIVVQKVIGRGNLEDELRVVSTQTYSILQLHSAGGKKR